MGPRGPSGPPGKNGDDVSDFLTIYLPVLGISQLYLCVNYA